MSDKDARLVEGAPLTVVTLMVNGDACFASRSRLGSHIARSNILPGDLRWISLGMYLVLLQSRKRGLELFWPSSSEEDDPTNTVASKSFRLAQGTAR